MKIALIYDVIYPFVKGGVEKRVWELAIRLARKGHEVHIVGMNYWGTEEIIVREGVTLHGICPAKPLYRDGRRSIGEAIYFSGHLVPFLMRNKFDIIDCQQFPYVSCLVSAAAAGLKRTPLVITWHEVWGKYWYEYLGLPGFFGKVAERLVSRITSSGIAVSQATFNNLIHTGCSGQIAIIPNGVDLQHIDGVPPSGESSDIIFIGRLIREKHADVLIRAFSLLAGEDPAMRLLIIGDGPEQDRLLGLVEQHSLKDQVRFTGFFSEHEEIIARMKSSKVCVIPSTREGFGIAALEALACGTPVVTTDHPANAIRDLITGENGVLSSLSEEVLAQNIRHVLRNHEQMKESCIASARHYDWSYIADTCETFYLEEVRRRSGPVMTMKKGEGSGN